MWWCMECGNCSPGDSIYIDWCGSSSRQQFVSVGSTIRPLVDQSLCMTTTGHSESNPIRLYKCNDNDTDQKFDGYRDSGSFELSPREEPNHCVGQMHHPKRAERVYPQLCDIKRNDDTSRWITY
ncbi:hypothetical protein ACHAW5_011177 [Stephanodiscus triporus]|uniref:Ricin B lectin domain-containing protein n=1 Tax=Stephanodiscus triporus TaxID=2934178 RepID=A0ABD3PRI6_9STRA